MRASGVEARLACSKSASVWSSLGSINPGNTALTRSTGAADIASIWVRLPIAAFATV
ncbi:hypothetical protein DRA46_01002 [Burkholderia gladioli]|nr:hypothetical protein [Burkholderia gladioli]